MIPISRQGGPLFRQVYDGLRDAILSGAYSPGARLPSTRELAEQLGLSRTVVLMAFDQLLAEGYVTGKGGSGTFVAPELERCRPSREKGVSQIRLSPFGQAAAELAAIPPRRRSSSKRYDFAYGQSDLAIFPFEMWRRLLLKQARLASANKYGYGPAVGSLALREAISGHVRRHRAVNCDPSEIIIVNGSQQALDLIARVLVARGDGVVVEDPHYEANRAVMRAAGGILLPVPVDRDGLDTSRLPERAALAVVTPSHQFPTGAVLPLSRRLALLDWARRVDAVIVEDDYDGEFHYDGSPVESLQGLDTEGRVLYLGTFSRTVFPALRLGYLIVPKQLAATFAAAKWINDLHSATLEQETLAEFISGGFYERHLRRLRQRNAARRDTLLQAARRFLGDRFEITGERAGAHVVLWPQDRTLGEAEMIARAASRDVGVHAMSHCYLG